MVTRPIRDLDVPREQLEAEALALWEERDRRVAALNARQQEHLAAATTDRAEEAS
jgi:regulator of protease activity HflC (stomatin/prohibitin superfamily)